MNQHITPITREELVDQKNRNYHNRLETRMNIENNCRNSLKIASGINFLIGTGKLAYGFYNSQYQIESIWGLRI